MFRDKFKKNCLVPGQVDEFCTKVNEQNVTKKAKFMRHNYPETYVDCFRSIRQLETVWKKPSEDFVPESLRSFDVIFPTWGYYAEYLPRLTKMRESGKLLTDQKTLYFPGSNEVQKTYARVDKTCGHDYEGETDHDKVPYGQGKITKKGGVTIEGTFINGFMEGVIIFKSPKSTMIAEYSSDMTCGRQTLYVHDSDGKEISNAFADDEGVF